MNKDVSKSQLGRILQMTSINSLGLGLVSVFIPIFLLKLGYSFQFVMIWILIQHSSILLFSFVTVYFSNRIGLVHCLHIRFGFLLTYLILLFILPNNPGLFFIIPVLIGAEQAFYWMPLNILFVRNTERETMGGSLSKLFTYPQILSLACPLIGALIITNFGFQTLFIVALGIVFFAFLPLLPLRSEKTNFKFSMESARDIWTRNKRFFLPEVVDNFTEDAGVVLTLFIYLKLLSVTQIGIIGTLTSVAVIIFTLSIGKMSDTWNRHKLLRIGAVLVTASWLVNYVVGEFIPNQWIFYVATIFTTLSMKAFLVPYQSLLMNAARKDDAQFIILREIPTILGRLIMYSLALVLFSHLTTLFVITAVLFIFFWFVDIRNLAILGE